MAHVRHGGSGRIRVLYVIGTLDIGGTEGQLVELVKRLDPARFEPMLCTLSAPGARAGELVAAGIPVEVIGLSRRTLRRRPHRALAGCLRLVALMRRARPDIVHGLLFWAYVAGAFAARIAGVPIFVASRRSLGHFKAGKLHYILLERLATSMTDLIVANSAAVKQDVLRRESVPAGKIHVIHNGIDPIRYELTVDPRLRASLRVPEEARVLGVVANLIHYKNHRLVLDAFSRIKRDVPAATLLLIGDGPLRAELETLAKDLGLAGDVLFLGTRHDVPALLALIDVAILASDEEGFPNTVLEAMAAGRPVVATRVGGVPEAVVPHETGLLVPPNDARALADAVLQLLRDPARARAMGKAGRDLVRSRFHLHRMVRDTEALYASLCGTKGIPGGRR